jgi:dipeptidyl aminopeptidase/acylaminoacyl peptidase
MEQKQLLQTGDAPLLILHGTADHQWMPYAQAIRLRDSARTHGVPVTFVPLPGKNHGPWDDLSDYLDDITPFLRQHL